MKARGTRCGSVVNVARLYARVSAGAAERAVGMFREKAGRMHGSGGGAPRHSGRAVTQCPRRVITLRNIDKP